MGETTNQPVLQDLLIKADELAQLDQILGNVPTKYGFPVVQFLNSVALRRHQGAQALAVIKQPVAPAPTEEYKD